MATHLWLIPWLALVAGFAALMLGFVATRTTPSPTPSRLSLSSYAVWLLTTAVLGFASVRLGASGADFVTARGMVLGALGGAALAMIARRRAEAASAPLVFGLGTVTVAAARLWLTHGEVSGLIALAVGATLAVVCFSAAPALFERNEEDGRSGTATLGLLFLLCLLGTVQIGLTRAAVLQQEYWADVPLLLGAVLALTSVISPALTTARAVRHPSGLWPLLGVGLVVLLPLYRLFPSWRPVELIALGAVLFSLLARTGRDPEDRLGPLIGFVALAAGSALAFALWSGYGLGLMILGGWIAGGAGLLADPTRRAGRIGLGFAALLLVYRLATLQNSAAVHASGPGDIWDLFAISLGALLPLLAAEWMGTDAAARRLPRWAVTLQWVFVLAVPAVLLDYIWQPRSVTGVLLGAAVGQMLTGTGRETRARQDAVTLSALLLSLLLFQFLPLVQHLNEPTRPIRVGLVLLGASLLLGRLLVSGSGIVAKEKEDGALPASPRA